VSDKTPEGENAPGSRASDAAPTQQIPRIPPPSKNRTVPGKQPVNTRTTDKGRPRPVPAPPAPDAKSPDAKPADAKPADAKPADAKQPAQKQPAAKPAAKTSPAKTQAPAAKPGGTSSGSRPTGGPTGRPLTASDYARTTRQSASSTAVIPAVKDQPASSAKPSSAKPAPSKSSSRRASLRLVRVEPWSVTRLAFTISVALMIVAVVAVTIFWLVLDAVGVWGQVNDSITSVLSDDSSSFDITDYLGFWRLFGLTLVLSAINVVLMTALATIAAHLYNLAAQLLGGVEVTFAEEN
jgi:hypothetical protein